MQVLPYPLSVLAELYDSNQINQKLPEDFVECAKNAKILIPRSVANDHLKRCLEIIGKRNFLKPSVSEHSVVILRLLTYWIQTDPEMISAFSNLAPKDLTALKLEHFETSQICQAACFEFIDTVREKYLQFDVNTWLVPKDPKRREKILARLQTWKNGTAIESANENNQPEDDREDTLHQLKDESFTVLHATQNNLSECAQFVSDQDKNALTTLHRIAVEQEPTLENLLMGICVLGSVNSGKSSIINALMGHFILPTSSRAMTTVPVVCLHQPGTLVPILKVPKAEIWNKMVDGLKARLKDLDSNGKFVLEKSAELDDVCEILRERDLDFSKPVTGTDITAQLQLLNDLVRLGYNSNFEIPSPLEMLVALEDFPVVAVEFKNLRGIDKSIGNVCFIDTPGPNEAQLCTGYPLIKVVHTVMSKCCVSIFAIHLQLIDSVDVSELIKTLQKTPFSSTKNFVLVNHWDSRDKYDTKITEESIQMRVASSLFGYDEKSQTNKISPQDVFVVSAKRGNLANLAEPFIALGRVPDPAQESWVEDFADIACGEFKDEIYPKVLQKNNLKKFQSMYEKVWNTSKLSKAVNAVLRQCSEQSALLAMLGVADNCRSITEQVTRLLNLNMEILLAKESSAFDEIWMKLQQEKEFVEKNEKEFGDFLEQNIKITRAEVRQIVSECNHEILKMFDRFKETQDSREFFTHWTKLFDDPPADFLVYFPKMMASNTVIQFRTKKEANDAVICVLGTLDKFLKKKKIALELQIGQKFLNLKSKILRKVSELFQEMEIYSTKLDKLEELVGTVKPEALPLEEIVETSHYVSNTARLQFQPKDEYMVPAKWWTLWRFFGLITLSRKVDVPVWCVDPHTIQAQVKQFANETTELVITNVLQWIEKKTKDQYEQYFPIAHQELEKEMTRIQDNQKRAKDTTQAELNDINYRYQLRLQALQDINATLGNLTVKLGQKLDQKDNHQHS